jgi:hypothetical protein
MEMSVHHCELYIQVKPRHRFLMLDGLRQGLREFGYVGRQNFTIEQRSDMSISVRYAHIDINAASIPHAAARYLPCRPPPFS